EDNPFAAPALTLRAARTGVPPASVSIGANATFAPFNAIGGKGMPPGVRVASYESWAVRPSMAMRVPRTIPVAAREGTLRENGVTRATLAAGPASLVKSPSGDGPGKLPVLPAMAFPLLWRRRAASPSGEPLNAGDGKMADPDAERNISPPSRQSISAFFRS